MASVPVRQRDEWIDITAPMTPAWERILSPGAVNFLYNLTVTFEERRQELLEARYFRQVDLDAGALPDFLPQTKAIRESDWKVAPVPRDLMDRRVEITGPVDRKTIIDALNSGAQTFMADFEDANSPTWPNVMDGQVNLRDAVRRSIAYTNPEGRHYQLGRESATLMVRPRGWHLDEKHVRVAGKRISASIFDFGLYFYHNAQALVERGSGPYFYLPKIESHREARLWNDIFLYSQHNLGLPRGTIRATVLIDTILAAFEMDEILWELRDHSAGLNCGRWNYIFSFIKKFRKRPEFVLPNRAEVTMDGHFLKSYVDLLIQTCHRRGAHAMGGMAAEIPIESDRQANEKALEKVRQDKMREAMAGHDGAWVSHPGLVAVAKEVFNRSMQGPNQISRMRNDVCVTANDLLTPPKGSITEEGLRRNIDVGIQYLESWLRGNGCVPIYNLMEDAATAEICRAQVWQWIEHGAEFDDGRRITDKRVQEAIGERLAHMVERIGFERFSGGWFPTATNLLERLMTGVDFPEFLTQVAYDYIE